jgi:hypothetical protein
MVVFVVILNVLIGFGCLGVAWVLVQLRGKIASASEQILSIERSVDRILHPAPNAIYKAQRGSQATRQQYAKLEAQTQKIYQLLSILSLGRGVWLRRSVLSRPKR